MSLIVQSKLTERLNCSATILWLVGIAVTVATALSVLVGACEK